MTGNPSPWLPSERDYTADPPPARTAQALADEQAFTDIHGKQPRPYRRTVTAGAIDDYEPGA
ncbi:hypothetical protein ACFV0B_11280 [Streptomyces xanthophaeus]|uniref:hypothetical protein n=1 Tax=Streptomyces xanthophaeus TaxID=67385 RepID=UPI0036B3CCE5